MWTPSDPHRAQPAAFCVGGGQAQMTPQPGRPERTEALQHAKAQSGKLAIPAASQIIAWRTSHGRDRIPAFQDLRDDQRLVLGAPHSPAICTGEHLKPMNRLSVSIIHCIHSMLNGFHQTRRSGRHEEGDLETPQKKRLLQ